LGTLERVMLGLRPPGLSSGRHWGTSMPVGLREACAGNSGKE